MPEERIKQSAAEIANDVRSRRISAVEVAEETLAHVGAVEGGLGS